LSETIRHAFSAPKPDLVIVSAFPALRFALDHRDQMFPGVPIFFEGVDVTRIQGLKMGTGVTGITEKVDDYLRGSLDFALRSHPDTRNVAVISGLSDFEKYWKERLRKEVGAHQGNLQFIEFVGLPAQTVLNQVSLLPAHTIVFAQVFSPDSAHAVVSVFDLIAAISQRFPTYSIFNYCMGHGCIGGLYPDAEEEGREAGEIAARVLSGEKPENIPVEQEAGSHLVVDWRELRHWNIPESALPSGTVVLYREPTLWERGRKYFLTAIGVIVVQTLLISGLLWQRARKRNAEAVLRESEKRFRVMADSTPSLIWMCDQKGEVTYLNEQWVAFTGLSKNAGYGDMWTASVHPDDLQNVLDTLKKALSRQKPFSNECRLRRGDGLYRWMFGVASPRVNGDGSFAGFIVSAVDVTDQKTAQEVLENVSGQLIEAQEKERSRLARELHDDICQRLAMLSFKIEKLSRGGGLGQVSVADQLEQIWQQCSDLTGDVQALSHELHPSILDNLGLTTAVKSFCREVSEQNGVVVEFSGRNIPNTLPREISLSLFRVTQEAIHNAMKYSGEKHFEVRLQAKDTEIELEVSDRGIGFDTASIKNGNGLGLVSMAERIHQVNGTFKIDSEPNNGTRIHARVPLATQPKAMTAAAN
jgi:PAS domain S-box-containing protein